MLLTEKPCWNFREGCFPSLGGQRCSRVGSAPAAPSCAVTAGHWRSGGPFTATSPSPPPGATLLLLKGRSALCNIAGQIKVDRSSCGSHGNLYQIFVGPDNPTDNKNNSSSLINAAYVGVASGVSLTSPTLLFTDYKILICGAGSTCPAWCRTWQSVPRARGRQLRLRVRRVVG